MVAVKDKVQKFSDLPAKAPDGFTVRIIQQSGTNQDDYFVKFQTQRVDGSGVWEECLAPGAQLGLDKNTMPMGLVYDAGWKLKVLDWKQRATGNEELVKDPDFMGRSSRTFASGKAAWGSSPGKELHSPARTTRSSSTRAPSRWSSTVTPLAASTRPQARPPSATPSRSSTASCCAGTTSRPGHRRWHPHPLQGVHRHDDRSTS
jgi:hypothetical protein